MGQPLDKPSIAQVTRACWATAVAPASWETLVRQSATAASLSPSQLQDEVCSALLDLLSEASGSRTASPTTLSYLRHSLGLGSSSARSLVQPGVLAARLWLRPDASLTTVDSALAVVNAALDARGAATPAYAATSVEGTLEAIAIAGSILASQLEHSAANSSTLRTPTLVYILRLLTHPPIPLTTKDVDDSAIQRCLASLHSASSSLSAFVPQANDAVFLGQLQQKFASTRSQLDAKPVEQLGVPFNLDEHVSSADPDVALLIDDLLCRSTSSVGISNGRYAVARLAALLKCRIAEAPSRGSTPESALASAFLEILLATTAKLRSGEGTMVVESSFVYSRLPDVFSEMFRKVTLNEKCLDGLQGGLQSALRSFSALMKSTSSDSMDLDGPSASTALLNTLLTSLCRRELISHDVGASLVSPEVHPEELMPQHLPEGCYHAQLAELEQEGVREVLSDVGVNYLGQRLVAAGVQAAIASFAQNLDLPSLSALCQTLLDVPHVLEILFLHLEPRELLAPIRDFLDHFDTSLENFGDNHPIEGYGKTVLFLETVLSRFELYAGLPCHLGTSKGFFALWLPSAPAVYPLQGLDDESKAAVHGWVEGLFGEGISDELMHSTNPRVLLRVAPTICKQSLVACQAGVIDLDTLREGLSYFLQELLSFTLPGVVHWLVDEIGRTPPSPAQTTMLEILGVFVFADSLPRLVLELVSSSLMGLMSKLESMTPTPTTLDLLKLRKLVAPFRPASAATNSLASWSTLLSTSLPLSLASSPTPPPSLLAPLLHSSPPPSSLLSTLLALHAPLAPSPKSAEPYLLHSRHLRLASALLALPSPTSPSARLFPTLETLIRETLPWELMQLANIVEEKSVQRGQAVAEVLGAALRSALELEAELDGGGKGEGQVACMLDSVAGAVSEVWRRLSTGKKGEGKQQGRTTGVEAFVEKLLVREELGAASSKLRELRAI